MEKKLPKVRLGLQMYETDCSCRALSEMVSIMNYASAFRTRKTWRSHNINNEQGLEKTIIGEKAIFE